MRTTEQIVAEAVAAERRKRIAARAVQRGTCSLLRWRSDRYQPATWHRQIGRACDDVITSVIGGAGAWVAIGAPPRHGKSEHVGRGMGPRLMALRPGASVLYATSTDDRAEEVSLAARAVVTRLYESGAFPHLAPGPKWTATEWTTIGGNTWVGVGAGASTGGIGAHLIIPDDVTGSAERQASDAFKRRSRRWMVEDVLSRDAGGAAVCLMETRRGLDDLQGWVEAEYPGRFTALTWRCQAGPDDPWGRAEGEYLWPERYGPEWRERHPELVAGTPVWESLYQQRPVREGGALIQTAWTSRRYQGDPRLVRRTCSTCIVSADTAAKTASRNDPSAIQVWGLRGVERILLHAEVARLEIPELEARLSDTAAEWGADGIVIEEAGPSGVALVQTMQRRVRGVVGHKIAGQGDKVARMSPHLPTWAAGQVLLPEASWAPWVGRYVAEVTAVPAAAHDDEFDATTVALAWFADLDSASHTDRAALLEAVW